MNILRKLLGNNAVLSEPPAPAAATAAAAGDEPSKISKEEQLRSELTGADAARLTELALTDKRAAMRLLAAEDLAATGAPRATWEDIARTWTDKDRRLSRFAKERVHAYEHQAQIEARAAALHAEFSTLLDKPAVDVMRLIELDARYDALIKDAAKDAPKGAPTNTFGDLAGLRTQVGARIETGQQAQRELIAIEREADAARLALVAQQTVADPLVHAALAERFGAVDAHGVPAVIVEHARKALGALEALTQSAVARGVAEGAARELLARIEALKVETSEETAAESTTETTDETAAKTTAKNTEVRNALKAEIAATELPRDLKDKVTHAFTLRTGNAEQIEREAARQAEHALSDAERAERKAAQAQRVSAQKAAENAARDAQTAEITTLVDATEAHLAAGEAKAAIKAADAIKRARSAAEHLPGPLRARFHAIETEVLKLEGFSRDVAKKRRGELLSRAQKLPELKLNIDMLRSEVQALQTEWKKLDADSGGAPRKLWDEFHSATNKAYETVTLYRAAKTAERDENLKVKEAALAEIEALAAGAASETPDWKTIAAKRGQVVRTWYDLGGVGRKEHKPLQARMDRAVKALDASLDAERSKERARRQALIDQVETARVRAEAERPAELDARDRAWPALLDAMQVSQDCQKQWNVRSSPLPLPRKEEQALWEKFRKLGNTVFEMRAQAREAVKVQVQAERAAAAEREREARAAADARQARERDKWNVLAELDGLLGAAEQQLAAAGDVSTLNEKITVTVARLDAKHAAHKGLAARIALVSAAHATTGTAANAVANVAANAVANAAVAAKRRAELLLDLELALNIPAQPGEESARRARQLLLLSNTLKNRGARTEPRDMLLDLVAQPGAPIPERLTQIAAKL